MRIQTRCTPRSTIAALRQLPRAFEPFGSTVVALQPCRMFFSNVVESGNLPQTWPISVLSVLVQTWCRSRLSRRQTESSDCQKSERRNCVQKAISEPRRSKGCMYAARLCMEIQPPKIGARGTTAPGRHVVHEIDTKQPRLESERPIGGRRIPATADLIVSGRSQPEGSALRAFLQKGVSFVEALDWEI